MTRKYTYLVLAILFFMSNACTFADIYEFNIFTDNGDWGINGINAGDQLLDISVDVYNGAGSAKFKIMNNSALSLGTSITDIYFDDGSLLGIASITNQSDAFGTTSFQQPAIPSELPGANLLDPIFETSTSADPGGGVQYFSVDSDAPPSINGVQAGEWVIIESELINGGTILDILAELDSGIDLRIGLHVQSFGDGSSESMVNVPEPTTLLLFGLGGLLMRRRKA